MVDSHPASMHRHRHRDDHTYRMPGPWHLSDTKNETEAEREQKLAEEELWALITAERKEISILKKNLFDYKDGDERYGKLAHVHELEREKYFLISRVKELEAANAQLIRKLQHIEKELDKVKAKLDYCVLSTQQQQNDLDELNRILDFPFSEVFHMTG